MSMVFGVLFSLLFTIGPSPSTAATESPGSCLSSTVSPAPTAGEAAVSSASPASGDAVIRIPLSGAGPLGLAIVGDHAWVVAADSGAAIDVDLVTGRENAAYPVEAGGTHVAFSSGCVLIAGVGSTITVLDLSSGPVATIPTVQLESIVAGDDGSVWAIDHQGSVFGVDLANRTTGTRAPITYNPNEHIEGVWAVDALWVGSDTSVVNRVEDLDNPRVTDTLDVGGGIPLVLRDGLIWGARPDELWAIDPHTGQVVREVELGGLSEILALDVAGDEAWIAARMPGRVGVVERVGLTSGEVLDQFSISLPAAVVLTPDRAWVTSYETNELVGLPR